MKKITSIILAVLVVFAAFPLNVLAAPTVSIINKNGVMARQVDKDNSTYEFDGHFYRIYNETATKAEAEEFCEDHGGYLLTINSVEEDNFITGILARDEGTPNGYWLGITKQPDNTWQWDTSETMNYSDWSQFHPDSSDCVNAYIPNYNDMYTIEGNWIPTAAAENIGFICEWDISYPTELISTYNGHTYAIINKSVTWESAKVFCEFLGGHLLTIANSNENNYITNLIDGQEKPFFWIGLYQSGKSYAWVTGEAFSYSNWGVNEPTGNEPCTHIYSRSWDSKLPGTWNDNAGNGYGSATGKTTLYNYGFICEWDFEITEQKTAYSADGTSQYAVYNVPMAWTVAEQFCENMGGHLVVISTPEENDFVYSLIKDQTTIVEYWIGATDRNYEGTFEWVPYYDYVSKELVNEPFDYKNWDEGEPNNNQEYFVIGEDYVHMYQSRPTWNDQENGSDLTKHYLSEYGFICEWNTSADNFEKNIKKADCENDGYIEHISPFNNSIIKTDIIPARGHSFDEGVVTKAPDCTNEGEKHYTCTNTENEEYIACNHTKTDILPVIPDAHDWDDGVIAPVSDCTNHGTKTYTCKINPAHQYTEEVPLDTDNHIGETYIKDAKEPTCLENGYTGDTYCKGCDKLIENGEAIPATGHDWDEWKEVTAATCEKAGLERRICKNDASHIEERELTVLGHDWNDGVIDPSSDCVNHGTKTYTCKRDASHTYTEEVPLDPDNHIGTTYVKDAKEPTCLENGYTGDTYCKGCNKLLENGEAIPATGHDWDEWKEVTAAACEKAGLERRICKNDASHIEERSLKALGHDYIGVTTAPTCLEDGYTTYTCSRCGNTYVDDITPSLGHDWGEWTDNGNGTHTKVCHRNPSHTETLAHTWDTGTVTKVPTCTEKGEILYLCTVCNAEKREPLAIAPDNHSAEDDFTIDEKADCENDGSKSHHCSRCDKKLDEAVIPARGHSYDKGVVTKEPDCTNEGEKLYTCTNTENEEYNACSHTKTEILPVIPDAHDWDNGVIDPASDCVNHGTKTYTCKINPAHQYTEEVPIDSDNHIGTTYVKDAKDPTCLENGYTGDIYCKGCNKLLENGEAIPASGHDWDEWKVINAAECEKAGLERRICKNDASHIEERELSALGHDWDDGVIDPSSDCINHGTKTYTCQRDTSHTCTEEVPLDPDSHIGEIYIKDAKEPICLENGYTGDTYCKGCNKLLENGEAIPATGHDWDEWKVITDAACEKAGLEKRICKNDASHIEEREIPALVHDYVAVVTAPTCTTDGFTTHTCSLCGDSYTDSETIALGHEMGDNWYVYKEATYDESGEKRNDCQRSCGYYENEPISKLKYTITFVVNDGSNETVIKTVEYEKGAKSISVPSVPSKDGYVGFWEDYELNSAPEIKVKAIYEPKSTDNTSELETEKKAVYDEKTGVATITLNAFADTYNIFSSELVGTPLDIVLVVDQSGSMNRNMDNDKDAIHSEDTRRENLKNVAKSFVNTVYDNAVSTGSEHRISVVGFAGAEHSNSKFSYVNTGLLTPNAKLINYMSSDKKVHAITNEQYRNSLMSVQDSKDVILKAIDEIKSEGATAADLGLEMAANVFGNNEINTAERKRLVIFLTDGTPTYSTDFSSQVANNAIKNANDLKNMYGATIYSIGITNDANPSDNTKNLNKFLHRVSSNYSNATTFENGSGNINDGYYIAATNTQALQNIFNNIYVRTVATTVSFDSVTFHDTISEYFTLTTEQENVLRENLKNEYGLTADNITVTRNDDGTTTLEIRGVNTKKIYDSSNTMTGYGASIKFNVTANERALNAGIYHTNTDDAYLEIDGKKAAEFEVPNITINSSRNIVKFNIGDETYSISQLHIGDTIVAPDIDYAHWNIDENEVVTKSFTEFNATLDSSDRYISWSIGDKVILQNYKVGQLITAPEVKSDDNYLFDGWNSEVPYRMPDVTRLSFTAVFKVHEHAFTKLVGTNGNCEKDITKTYACLCGETETYTLPVTKHTYEANIVNVNEKSVATFRCTQCGDTYEKTLTCSYRAGNRLTYYDLKLYNAEGISVQPDGTIQIRIPITAEMKANLNNKTPVVYRYENGKYVKLTTTVEDNAYIIFTTDHFSTYILTANDVDTTAIGNEGVICEMEGHIYTETTVTHTCEDDGYTLHICSVCSNSYKDNIIPATDHTDNSGDGKCDSCGKKLSSVINCKHFCHSSNALIRFFWKIFRFISKIFGVNKVCSCGVAHY